MTLHKDFRLVVHNNGIYWALGMALLVRTRYTGGILESGVNSPGGLELKWLFEEHCSPQGFLLDFGARACGWGYVSWHSVS